MVETYQGNALCQAVKLEGLSSGSERRLEDRIRELISHNGYEFVVSVLKQLKQHCIDNLDERHPYSNKEYGSPTIAWDNKRDKPKGGLGVIYTEFKDWKKRLRVIGSVINTIELDQPSALQIERFMTGVEYNNRTDVDLTAHVEDIEVIKLSRWLDVKLKQSPSYTGEELTGSTVPEGMESRNIAGFKKVLSAKSNTKGSRERSEAIANLESAYVNQAYLAPKKVHQYVERHIAPGLRDRQMEAIYLKKPTPIKARPYDSKSNRMGLNIEDYRAYVGTIGMIQQPGAKLRTVVNVNRFINYAMNPFAEAIEKTIYELPQVAVLDQGDGMKWAQQQLRAGRELSSIDLSQATDLLDFRVLFRAIEQNKNCSPQLKETLELFSYIAESPFYQPELQVGVTMNTGQPLGLKGSFQVLTLMNYLAGRQACLQAGLNDLPFRVVGDDMIMDSRAAEYYANIIASWSGKTNYEKMLTSSSHAEFCSHIITKGTIMSMKPHYIAGYHNVYINAQKTSVNKVVHVYRLTAEDKSNLLALGRVSDKDILNIPFVAAPDKLPKELRRLVSIGKSLFTQLGEIDNSECVHISAQSVDLALQENPSVYTRKRRELDRSRYTRTPNGGTIYDSPSRLTDNDRSFNPVVDEYDHKTGKRVEKQSEKTVLKRSRKDAEVVRKLTDDVADGIASELKIPGHDRTVSTTALLVTALEIQEHEAKVNSSNDETYSAIRSNEIPTSYVEPKESLSDAQVRAKLAEIVENSGLTSLDADPEIDYSIYLQ